MKTINDLFINVINEGLKSIQGVSDPSQKTLAYAELAKALAMTGKVGSANMEPQEESVGKEALKEVPKDDKPKETPKASAKKEETKEPVAPKKESKAVKTEEAEPELSEEWNEEMMALKEEQINALTVYKEEYDEESLDQAVKMFSEGQLESLADISPLNIDAFLTFLESLLNQAE